VGVDTDFPCGWWWWIPLAFLVWVFACGRSRRCGAVQRVVEFLLARKALACKCENVPGFKARLVAMLKMSASGRHELRADAQIVLDHGSRGASVERLLLPQPSTLNIYTRNRLFSDSLTDFPNSGLPDQQNKEKINEFQATLKEEKKKDPKPLANPPCKSSIV
jgi:hypothetical protein